MQLCVGRTVCPGRRVSRELMRNSKEDEIALRKFDQSPPPYVDSIAEAKVAPGSRRISREREVAQPVCHGATGVGQDCVKQI
jgi:hypothetical protein